MKGLKVFLLAIILFLLIFVGLVYQAGLTAEFTVLDESFYRDLFAETDLVNLLHEAVHERLHREIAEQMPKSFAAVLTGVLVIVYDEAWMEEQILAMVDDMLLYVRGEQPELEAAINLKEKNEELREILKETLELVAAPVLAAMGFDPQAVEEIAVVMINELSLPDQLALDDILSEQGTADELGIAAARIRQCRGLYTYLPYTAFILFFIFSYLLVGTDSALKWFGSAVLISGAAFYLALQSLHLFLPVLLETVPAKKIPLAPEIFSAAVEYAAEHAAVIPIGFASVGLVLVLTGLLAGWLLTGKESGSNGRRL